MALLIVKSIQFQSRLILKNYLYIFPIGLDSEISRQNKKLGVHNMATEAWLTFGLTSLYKSSTFISRQSSLNDQCSPMKKRLP